MLDTTTLALDRGDSGGNVRGLFDVGVRPWLRDMARAYSKWTAVANGAGLDKGAEVDSKSREWDDVYFDLLSRCLPGMSAAEVDALALDPIKSFPNASFYDAAGTFLREVDSVYFNGNGLAQDEAVRIRTLLADRLIDSSGWRWNATRHSSSIEMHLGPAVATFFFNAYGYFQPPKAYLLERGVDRLLPFLPLPDRIGSDFWINHGVGHRVCVLLGKTFRRDEAGHGCGIARRGRRNPRRASQSRRRRGESA